MDTPSPAALFALWERARRLDAVERSRAALRTLGLAEPDLGQLTVGQADTLLMDLRARAFGASIAAVAGCPACGEQVDVEFDLRDVWTPPSGDLCTSASIAEDDFTVQVRPACLDDLSRLACLSSDEDRAVALLRCCVLEARKAGELVAVEEIPPEFVVLLDRALAELDPQADVQLSLGCPTCGRAWLVPFDIAAFFWDDLDAWVRRTARDVGTLAAHFGWAEADILAMGADRRALYLELTRP